MENEQLTKIFVRCQTSNIPKTVRGGSLYFSETKTTLPLDMAGSRSARVFEPSLGKIPPADGS